MQTREVGRTAVSGSAPAFEHRAEERFEAVAMRLGPQVAARVDQRSGEQRVRAARASTGANAGVVARNASATPSFSSGSLEQVA